MPHQRLFDGLVVTQNSRAHTGTLSLKRATLTSVASVVNTFKKKCSTTLTPRTVQMFFIGVGGRRCR